MRNMSFSLTKAQFVDGTKTVTRRLGWKFLRPGDRLMAVEKAQGLKKGETMVRMGPIKVIDVRRERLDAITYADVIREGFVGTPPHVFVEMFCAEMKCAPDRVVTRIEFVRTEPRPTARKRDKTRSNAT